MPIGPPQFGMIGLKSLGVCLAVADSSNGGSPESGGAIQPHHLFLIAGILFVIFLLQFYGRRKRSRRPDLPRPSSAKREPTTSGLPLRASSGIGADMQELLVELQELSRSINAQMDTKFARLDSAIRSADQRIADLEQLVRRVERLPRLDLTIDDDAGEAPLSERHAEPPAAGPAGGHEKRDRIFKLADQGTSPTEIARHVQLTTGEVELILALRGS